MQYARPLVDVLNQRLLLRIDTDRHGRDMPLSLVRQVIRQQIQQHLSVLLRHRQHLVKRLAQLRLISSQLPRFALPQPPLHAVALIRRLPFHQQK